MKKSLLVLTMVGFAFCANAQDNVTYNFFDPEDCDAEGWLWLDTQEKIDKYVGEGKKIQLVNAQYELESPQFPGEYFTPESSADPALQGYNPEGVVGGEGSKTGGIILPSALYEEGDMWPLEGGGILVAMPDCASFNLYISQGAPNIMTALYAARVETNDPSSCTYLWDDDYSWDGQGGPISESCVAWDLNMQDIELDLEYGESATPDILSFYGEKGQPRTAVVYNYSYDPSNPMYIQGINIRTFTSVSSDDGAGVKSLEQDNLKIAVKDGMVSVSSATQISVYSTAGVKVASTYGTTLDCSSLKGVFFVKARNKTVKAVF